MKVKICGIKQLDDLKFCIDSGVYYIGLNFYIPSTRFCGNGDILSGINSTNLHKTKLVALVVSNSFREIDEILQDYPIDIVQFSDGYTADFLSKFDCERIATIAEYNGAQKYENVCEKLLLDASRGQGILCKSPAPQTNKPYGIAGGINSENVSLFKELYPNADFLDLASGAETDGVFSREKVAKIMKLL